MTVYIDKLFYFPPKDKHTEQVGKRWNNQWCHLWADDIDELINFATSIGLKKEWLQKAKTLTHFDLTPSRRIKAIAKGAVEMNLRDWFKKEKCKLFNNNSKKSINY